MKEPKVTLIAHTPDPIKTIYEIWQCSKYEKTLEEVQQDYLSAVGKTMAAPIVETAAAMRGVPVDQSRGATYNQWTNEFPNPTDLFAKLLDMKVPVMENIDLVFMLENVSVSFREQMVRHRIGVKVGERLGVDFAPEISDSTWWSQSMRILDMTRFANNGNFIIPEWFRQDEKREMEYRQLMYDIQANYAKWVEQGCPMEQAREVIPLGSTHSISWKLNVASLLHIIGKRGCWILQLGYWGPIIKGMVAECVEKIHPAFAKLITPPCIKNEKFNGCLYNTDNQRRYEGEDKLPPCSLWVHHQNEGKVYTSPTQQEEVNFNHMRLQYKDFWRRDPDTGELL